MAFDIDFGERGLIKEHIWKFLLFPEHWNNPANGIPHNLTWNEVPFNNAQINNVPADKKGIYCFVVKPDFNKLFETRYLFYIGQTTRSFRVRYKEYLDDQEGKGKPRPKVFTMLKLWKDCLHFYYADLVDDNHIEECEVKLLNTFVPKVNTDIPIAKIKPELKNIYE
ncbi:MAG: hypothetical protein A2W93_12025 [Bacteroidetes bacterium GWF2_43_63]|nr:MAG: hypothetical protein A2W94_11615 [Bacteroidetes bacterium GWE2_42_42]OFY56353.1 MAG: hypothetical protein A2W93_12025 [Bacteroidetes bacterium GWF2_43_63]HBG69685.1 hypothetical protein [Bacteroidales bacterium]HCB61952.1 hypothetical protein [Bacteroidales bacterium]HCY42269.1 hypothetical protein [Prolixibacteraceae bacterium]